MIDSVVRELVGNGLAAHHFGANGINAAGLDVLYFGKVNAVFVAEREIREEVLESVNAALGKKFGALRAHTFYHADIGGEVGRHWQFFIPLARMGCGSRSASKPT